MGVRIRAACETAPSVKEAVLRFPHVQGSPPDNGASASMRRRAGRLQRVRTLAARHAVAHGAAPSAEYRNMKRFLISLVLAFALLATGAHAAKPRSIEQAKALMRGQAPGFVPASCSRAKGAIRCDLYRDAKGWRHLRRGTWAVSGRLTITKPRRVCRVSSRKGRCAIKLKRS